MPFALHKECRKRLLELLETVFQEVKIKNDYFIDWDSFHKFFGVIDRPLEGKKEILTILDSCIGETPLFIFLWSEITKIIRENNVYNPDAGHKRIVEYDKFADVSGICSELLDKFCKLPYEYDVFVKVPKCFSLFFRGDERDVVIADGLKLLFPNAEFIGEYPLETEVCLTSLGVWSKNRYSGLSEPSISKRAWDQNYPYIQLRINGYFAQDLNTRTIDRCLEYVKSVVGAFTSLGSFNYNFGNLFRSRLVCMDLYQILGENVKHGGFVDLDPDFSNAISNMEFDNIGGSLNEDQFKEKYSATIVAEIRNLFDNNFYEERIIAACRWYFESQNTANNLLSYLYLTIVVEILLGEDKKLDRVGITELLGNRCAYLLGETKAERSALLQNFSKIYNIRSQIVHRGKSRLTSKESGYLQLLKILCKKIIRKEISLLG